MKKKQVDAKRSKAAKESWEKRKNKVPPVDEIIQQVKATLASEEAKDMIVGLIPKYEYFVTDVEPHLEAVDIIKVLNEFGKDGWQLVDVFGHRRYTFIRQVNITDI